METHQSSLASQIPARMDYTGPDPHISHTMSITMFQRQCKYPSMMLMWHMNLVS